MACTSNVKNDVFDTNCFKHVTTHKPKRQKRIMLLMNSHEQKQIPNTTFNQMSRSQLDNTSTAPSTANLLDTSHQCQLDIVSKLISAVQSFENQSLTTKSYFKKLYQ